MARARLLVVDDEQASAEQVVELLGDGMVEVTSLTTGDEALRTALEADKRGRAFDVVLLDYYMPHKGGVEVLRELNDLQLDSRVIIMSGRDPGDVAVEAMRIGAFDFISKPLNRAELKLRVERALRDRRSSGSYAVPDKEAAKRRPRRRMRTPGCSLPFSCARTSAPSRMTTWSAMTTPWCTSSRT